MPPLFDAWQRDPAHAGVLLDFDGTLAAIVADPADARLSDRATAVLGRLAARYRMVGVVSGRPAAFLAGAGIPAGVERWGAYGLERVDARGQVITDPEALAWRPQVAEVVDAARRSAPPGVGIEDKEISLTLHVRADPSREWWVRDFAAAQAARTGLAVHGAKMSVELRPPLSVDKGSVVRAMIADGSLKAACYVGDDLGDLPAFAALSEVEVAVRVVARSDETPPAVLEVADLVVDGPPGVVSLLEELVQAAPS